MSKYVPTLAELECVLAIVAPMPEGHPIHFLTEAAERRWAKFARGVPPYTPTEPQSARCGGTEA